MNAMADDVLSWRDLDWRDVSADMIPTEAELDEAYDALAEVIATLEAWKAANPDSVSLQMACKHRHRLRHAINSKRVKMRRARLAAEADARKAANIARQAANEAAAQERKRERELELARLQAERERERERLFIQVARERLSREDYLAWWAEVNSRSTQS